MRIGILADIHEDVEALRLALERLRQGGAEQFVVLGDVFDTGKRVQQAVALLAEAGAVGVWGNHELGLCHEPEPGVRRRYAGPVLDYLATLRPRLELHGCLFTHGLPCWDATDPAVYYLGARPEEPEAIAQAVAAGGEEITFVGHFHRWLAVMPGGCLPWAGATPLHLRRGERWLVVVAAVCDGWCALFDTESRVLEPKRLAGGGGPLLPHREDDRPGSKAMQVPAKDRPAPDLATDTRERAEGDNRPGRTQPTGS
ncbi:MAG: metallophosphoesterase [Gemmataceae bacterium]|nr:metallophosphoesterase [Gemmataceae bacterium]